MAKEKPEIIYQDADLLIVNKPTGITVIPERIHTERENLQGMLQAAYGKLFVVHRIDRGTSGLICFARNEAAHKNLSLQFQNHQVKKVYKAIVSGHMEAPEGKIEMGIAESNSHAGTMVVSKKGKDALTLYKVQQQFKHAALLDVEIKTGRTHQIRVHMAAIGHPLLVDDVYGKAEAFFFSTIKRNYKPTAEEERPTIARLTLHAFELGFTHPASGKEVSFQAPLPKDIETVLKLLRKYDV